MSATNRAICEEELLGHLGWVQSLALRLVGDVTRAEDLTQEVCRTALECPPDRARTGFGLRAWLRTVTRFLARNALRSHKRQVAREAQASRTEATPSTVDVVARNALVQRVSRAVMALPEPYRSTVLYRYLDGCGSAEVAALMGVSRATVRKRMSRGLQMLRVRLVRQGLDRSVLGALFALPVKEGVAAVKVSALGSGAIGSVGVGSVGVGGLGLMASNVKAVTGLALLGGTGVLCGVLASPPEFRTPPEAEVAQTAAAVTAWAGDQEPTAGIRSQQPLQRQPLATPLPAGERSIQDTPLLRRTALRLVEGQWAYSPERIASSDFPGEERHGMLVAYKQALEDYSKLAIVTEETLPDGFHVLNHESGARKAAGMVRNGSRVDAWSEWLEDGSPSSRGSYVHGQRHGPWTFWGSTGTVRSAGSYLYGKKEGDWLEHGKEGERHAVSYRGGKRYGVERIWHLEGGALKSETTWYADSKDGSARTWYPDGQLESRGSYSKGEPAGLWEYWHPDGTPDEVRTGVVEPPGSP